MDTTKPKILYLISQLGQGGAEQQFYYLLKYLKPNATIISLAQGGYWGEPIRALGYTVIELERAGSFDMVRLKAVVRLIQNHLPDIIHVFTDGVPGIYGRLGALINRHPRVIVGVRSYPTRDPSWYSFLRRRLFDHYAIALVANARQTREYLIRHDHLSPEKAKFIPNGIELERFSPGLSPDRKRLLPDDWCNKVIVGTVGALANRKSPETYVQVAHHILEKCDQVRFVHVGDGSLKDTVYALCQELGIQDRILFLGARQDVPNILQALDIFVLTSRNEGTPNAVMEAMATQLPCVVTNTGDCNQLIIDHETGFVAEIGDVDYLADRIMQLIQNPEQRLRMGRQAYERIQAFDVHQMSDQYRALYYEVLNKA
jgi:glycosyltransferase involved in cell wall biosynthesis